MKILNAKQIREADRHTIATEPINSIDLMERASLKCFEWISTQFEHGNIFHVFCGVGNNGGDGLAIARILHRNDYQVICYVVEFSDKKSPDFITNYNRLKEIGCKVETLNSINNFPEIEINNSIIIDAIFGTGLTRPIEGFTIELIKKINSIQTTVISIDIPSGLFCEDNSTNNFDAIIKATHTLSFEVAKLAFVLPENVAYCGNWHILPIGLDKSFIDKINTPYLLLTKELVQGKLKTRNKFSHKGTYGHALIISGSEGKIGASVLAASACLRSGAGLITGYIPQCGIEIMQTTVPEAMVIPNEGGNYLKGNFETENKYALAIGPGIGTNENTAFFVKSVIQNTTNPIVIDADAINILTENKTFLSHIPENSILTPHPKEFERLVGKWRNDTEKLALLKDFSKKHTCYTLLKGAHTAIACPDGKIYFNTTGNPGMATGGSGDVLTGIIVGLLAQKYSSMDSCLLGVYLHGLAGDIAVKEIGEEALIASDIVNNLGKAYLQFKTNRENF